MYHRKDIAELILNAAKDSSSGCRYLKNNHIPNVVQFSVNPFRRCGVVDHNKIKSGHPKKGVHSYIMAHKFIGIRMSLSNQAKSPICKQKFMEYPEL